MILFFSQLRTSVTAGKMKSVTMGNVFVRRDTTEMNLGNVSGQKKVRAKPKTKGYFLGLGSENMT